MRIDYCPYELVARTKINSKLSHRERQGALFRVEFSGGLVGYGDCHPWVELGDQPLDQQMNSLQMGIETPLTHNMVTFALQDAKAREAGISLFEGLKLPESHLLIPDLTFFDKHEILLAIEEGFIRFKVKLGGDLKGELPKLRELIALFPSTEYQVRADFNLKLSEETFSEFLKNSADLKDYFDFYEDPYPFDQGSWKRVQEEGSTLAADHKSESVIGYLDASKVLIFKPAIQKAAPFGKQKIVFTSYLDHPVGQLFAAYTAASFYKKSQQKIEICGLLSHRVYEENAFSRQIISSGPKLLPPNGTGIGFDQLLQKQNWRPLCSR